MCLFVSKLQLSMCGWLIQSYMQQSFVPKYFILCHNFKVNAIED